MIAPAYEDPAQWIVKEGNLPENVTPENSKLKDPEERHRIARVFSRGLTEPSGYVLPIQRWQAKATETRWRSERWKTRRGGLYLAPGDSPVGYRLPLGSLPHVPPASFPYVVEADPTVPREPLPEREAPKGHAQQVASFSADRAALPGQERIEQTLGDIDGAVRTALTRRGARRAALRLHAAGRTARGLSRAGRGGGSGGRESRTARPDRGLCPAGRSAPQRDPRRAGPGRHRGQHPSRRELARVRGDDRGDLRRGAAGAARRRQVHDRRPPFGNRRRQPRRGRRRDAARQSFPAAARPPEEPRHLLAQTSVALAISSPACSSGRPARRRASTRRATTASTSWRSRWRRFRSPARASDPALAGRSSLAQHPRRRHRQHASGRDLHRQALFPRQRHRAARARRVARLRDAAASADEPRPAAPGPRDRRPVLARPARAGRCRWGTALHDRFMLPHFVWAGFRRRARRICEAPASPSDSDWFEAHREFRFPLSGEVESTASRSSCGRRSSPGTCSARTGAIGGTARYVDSSVERLQVKLRGSTRSATSSPATAAASRCIRPARRASRGRRGPLQGLAAARWRCIRPSGARAAGLRLVRHLDRPRDRRLHLPCRPPGRPQLRHFSRQRNEAEARRLARFEPLGHTPGSYEPPPETPHPEFPLTLDLRRPTGM